MINSQALRVKTQGPAENEVTSPFPANQARGDPRALKTPHRGVFARRSGRRARAVRVPDVSLLCLQHNKKHPTSFKVGCLGAPSGTRTQDPLIKSQLLYQLS